MNIPDLRWNRAREIAPLVCSYGKTLALKREYHVYGSEKAIAWFSNALRIDGYRKGLFQAKRDFVAATILSNEEAYVTHGAFIMLLYRAPNGEQEEWLGTGGRSAMDTKEWIESMQSVQPLAMVLEIDISPIHAQLRPLLQFAK